MMIKHLTKHGNSLDLVIDRGVLDVLGSAAGSPLEISTDGSRLVVNPVRDLRRQKAFQAALKRVNRRYGKALKRLAE